MLKVAYMLDSNFHVFAVSTLSNLGRDPFHPPNPVGEVALLLGFGLLECSGLEWDLSK